MIRDVAWTVRPAVVAAVLLVGAASAVADAAAASRWTGVERIVAVADVHGAHDELVGLLSATGLVDESLAWTGEQTHLVSLGDLLDRGGDSRAVMDLLMRLQKEAPAAGGQVHVVLGNHEHMNLIGDLRYVAPAEFAAFADEESEDARTQARAQFHADPGLVADEQGAAFDKRHPPGYFAHRAAFRPDGRYGAWLLSLPTMIVVNDTAFVHGGLPEATVQWTAEQLNERFSADLRRYLEVWRELVALGALPDDEPQNGHALVTDEIVEDPSRCVEERALACEKIEGNGDVLALLEEFARVSDATVNNYDSPFWYRGSVYCRDILERPVLDAHLDRLGAQRVVVGHTPTTDRRVRAIRDGKVIMADTGMLVSYYDGRPAALVIEDGTVIVQYLNPNETAATDVGMGPVAYGLSEVELPAALREAAVTAVDRASTPGYWRVNLHHEGRSIRARFFPKGRGGAAQELAAAALDGLLGTELVAPTVNREIEGTEGALQLVYPDEMSEERRSQSGAGFDSWCPMPPQFQLMYAFDLLTANAGRSSANIVYGDNNRTLRLTGHAQAFGKAAGLPGTLNAEAITLAPGLADALVRLDQTSLETALGEHVDKRRIKALLSRRDEILARFGG